MDPARWKRLEPLLDQLLELPAPDRIHYLEQLRTSDPQAGVELEVLLHWCDRPDGFLERPVVREAASLLSEPEPGSPVPASIGPFRIVRELGQGGMGAVYLAERADGQFEQRVALKLIRGVFTPGDYLVRRFLEERRILASLQHSGIARLLDGGMTPDGFPWFAMELVEGQRIDRYSDRQRLPIEQRLRLFMDVCDAVQYAHQNLVVHRDLKPSNILVTDTGSIKLLDFGIARLVTPGDGSDATESTLRALTPDYASPEQIRGEPLTTATDVYSLGVILYEQLTGDRPYRLTGRSSLEIDRTLSEREIPPPSNAAARVGSAVAAHRGTTPERLARRLRGDLDTIVLAALRTEPDRRYGSAEQLALDIRRHLEGRPVSAHRDTIGYRSARFIGRHRIGVAAAALIGSLLIGTTVVTQVQSRRTARERDKAAALSGFMIDLFAAPDPWYGGGASLTVRELLDSGAARIGREFHSQPEMKADLLNMIGRSYQGLGLFDQAEATLESALVASRRTGSDFRIARDMMWLGSLASDQEDFAAAESLSRSALARQRRAVPEGSPELMSQLIYLAEVLRKTGRLDEAESLVREAVAIARRQRPEAPLRLALMLNDLGHVLRDRGDHSGAMARYREALKLRRAALGRDHPDVANLELNLARVLHLSGDTAAADLMRHAIQVKRGAFGDDHPEIAWDRAELAAVLEDRGAWAEAESLYRAALTVQRRALPPGHTRTATTLLGLGRVLLARGDRAGARPLMEEALGMYQRAAWRNQGRIEEAKALLASMD